MEKVLIVDNDLDSLDTLERVLRKEFAVFRAGNGFEAIHVLDREGEMALVISELSMPVVDGVEFLMGIMHAYPDTVRVVLTRSLDPDLLLAAVNDLKLFRYMVKPFNRDELLLVVRQGAGLYRLGKGQKMNVPPVGVLQFPDAKPEYLTIEIDQDQCQSQVEALISSSFFQALSQETDVTPPPQSRSEHFTFLDDYSTPEIAFNFFDQTKPQHLEEDKEDTVFLIREFTSLTEQKDKTTENKQTNEAIQSTIAKPIDLEETKPQEDTLILIREFVNEVELESEAIVKNELETTIQNLDSSATKRQEEEVILSMPEFIDQDCQAKSEEVSSTNQQEHPKIENNKTSKNKKRPLQEKSLPEENLIEEIDTLIQKLEEQENSKPKSSENTDNPLDSPEFKELQRQSNALIARIIRSWG